MMTGRTRPLTEASGRMRSMPRLICSRSCERLCRCPLGLQYSCKQLDLQAAK